MTQNQDELSLTVTKTIHADIEETFDSWLNAESLAGFILPMPGMANPEVSVDPVVGGEFEIVMDTGERKIPHTGTYTQIERPQRLQFTWNSPFSAPDSIVTIDFRETGPGETDVTLTHEKFPDQETQNNHHNGWSNIMAARESMIGKG